MADGLAFAERVAVAAISAYNNLKKTGKPQVGREWTLLAAILKTDNSVIAKAGGNDIPKIM